MTHSTREPVETVRRLADSVDPYLIGVRHHSPVLAAAIPALLESFRPDLVLVELPEELGEWLPWLAHAETVTPVALAAVREASDQPMGFYPFADFSPELAAIRWAAGGGIEVATCDLPLADPEWGATVDSTVESTVDSDEGRLRLSEIARAALTGRHDDDLWDRWVEAPAAGSAPGAVRRAALAVGWALRQDAANAGGVEPRDLAREAWMRRRIVAATGRRVAVVVGAFHAPALVGPAGGGPDPAGPVTAAGGGLVTSLVPYTFDLLDSRSGYPAGIRDPQWQQAVFDCGARPSDVEGMARAFAVRVTSALRAAGHPAGPAEAGEVARLAIDLARLRGLPAPGRGELVEALQTTLAQGEPTGRGRAVALAMNGTLIGDRRGRLASGAPQSGLLPAVTALLARLRLPKPGDAAQAVRLDPLRSPLDRRREVALQRLAMCQVPYARPESVVGVGGVDALGTSWWVHWTPATDATIALAGLRGVTLAQAAEGRLRTVRAREVADGGPTAAQSLVGFAAAAACGLPAALAVRIGDVAEVVCHGGTLPEIVVGIDQVERLRAGHVPGLPDPPNGLADLIEELYAAAVRAVDGLAGSTLIGDAQALLALVHRAGAAGRLLRLGHALARMASDGTPLMQGAAGAVRVVLGLDDPAAFGERLASWVDTLSAEMTARLQGALTVAGPILEAGAEALTPLLRRVEDLADDEFLQRLPALRGGFDALSPAARDRMLTTVTDRIGGDLRTPLTEDPATLAGWLAADLAGRDALTALGLEPATLGAASDQPAVAIAARGDEGPPAETRTVSAIHRWRLILARTSEALPAAGRRLATALDELYGTGRGEGSYIVDDGVGGGGREAAFPSVREWREELDALFGASVREEVLARAASAGRLDVAMEIDPASVRPSVDLLHAVLSLAGGLPEAQLARLRPLVARIVAALTAKLARQLRPALTGMVTPRRTRRPSGILDLSGTVRANLRTARRDADGVVRVVPERPVFRARGRRSVQWRVIVLADVSGSMEPSTIWAAMTASILAGVPALRTHFLTFSTEVIDLTDRLDDPLRLLLEVHVGGGTHIAKALRYARDLVSVPSRTMVVVVSDFEEGYPMGELVAEVRNLVNSGCRLLGCASLDDTGTARYCVGVAEQLVAAGMPVAALSPLELARWVGDQVT